ncbi:hypothetical protein GCM10008965_00350 [Methylorubrum aminovorans]
MGIGAGGALSSAWLNPSDPDKSGAEPLGREQALAFLRPHQALKFSLAEAPAQRMTRTCRTSDPLGGRLDGWTLGCQLSPVAVGGGPA